MEWDSSKPFSMSGKRTCKFDFKLREKQRVVVKDVSNR